VFGVEGQGNWADFRGSNVSLTHARRRTIRSKVDAFGLFTGQVGWAANNVLFYVKGGAAVTADRYDITTIPATSSSPRPRRQPLGWRGRRRPRIWLRPELVGRRRIRSPVHGQPHQHVHDCRRRSLLQQRAYPQDVDLVTVRVNYRWGAR
jgi:outer membrane immunogenic protein